MAIELVELCTIDAVLSEPIVVGDGPSGTRMIFELLESTVTGDRFSGTQIGRASADWVTISGTVGTLDVRATIQTHDGAIVFASYLGRVDLTHGPGSSPIFVAPLFETADDRYRWLNTIQGVGKGSLDGTALHYEWYELR